MYRQVASILIHRMIIFANSYGLLRDDFSLGRIKLERRNQETQKQYSHRQRLAAGALRHQHTTSLSGVALLTAADGWNKAKVGLVLVGCSTLKKLQGGGWTDQLTLVHHITSLQWE